MGPPLRGLRLMGSPLRGLRLMGPPLRGLRPLPLKGAPQADRRSRIRCGLGWLRRGSEEGPPLIAEGH
ncbi:hypothetical protein GCM10023144_27080 [Pigmentiphaga soli]|uniref:Uncharacterized protein n=1 Tax=Pigmentiphaga soli TaxID=1007095 RepID=A0ABP8H5D0_9BURK